MLLFFLGATRRKTQVSFDQFRRGCIKPFDGHHRIFYVTTHMELLTHLFCQKFSQFHTPLNRRQILNLVFTISVTSRELESHTFTQKDLDVCAPGAEINDTVVDFALDFMIKKFDLGDKVLRLTTHWYESHIYASGKLNASGGISMRNIPNFFLYEFILVPIHYNGHSSLGIVNPCDFNLSHLDSLPGPHDSVDIKNTIGNVIQPRDDLWACKVIDVALQGTSRNRGVDCGIHIIMNAEIFLKTLAAKTIRRFAMSHVDFNSIPPAEKKRQFLKLLMEKNGNEAEVLSLLEKTTDEPTDGKVKAKMKKVIMDRTSSGSKDLKFKGGLKSRKVKRKEDEDLSDSNDSPSDSDRG